MDTEVLIVGAGPVGLMAAIELRRRGIDVVIIDKRGDVAPWVKAVCVHPRAPNAATTMRGQLAYVNGRQVGRVDFALPAGEPYRFIALPQYATEKVFAAHLGRFRATVRRRVQLRGFTHDDCVTAALRESGGETSLSARYLIGADGTRGTVRNRTGLAFLGDALPERSTCWPMCESTETRRAYAVRSTHQTVTRRLCFRADVRCANCTPDPARRLHRVPVPRSRRRTTADPPE